MEKMHRDENENIVISFPGYHCTLVIYEIGDGWNMRDSSRHINVQKQKLPLVVVLTDGTLISQSLIY